jgi:hypothetical protein
MHGYIYYMNFSFICTLSTSIPLTNLIKGTCILLQNGVLLVLSTFPMQQNIYYFGLQNGPLSKAGEF